MKIFDAHIHPFSAPDENLSLTGEPLCNTSFIEELKAFGISAAAGSVLKDESILKNGIQSIGFEAVKQLNSSAYAMQTNSGGFYYAGVHIHPAYVNESLEELRLYADKGVKIIGELCGYMMGFEISASKNMLEILKLAEELDFAVCFHTDSVREIIGLAKHFKKLRMIFAHPSYGEEFKQRLSVIKKQDNLWMDLSGTGIAAHGMLEYAVNEAGSEKLIFGTDYPIYNPTSYIACVANSKLLPSAKENIFYRNAKNVYRI